jgi:choline dehydrogenase
VVVTRILLDGQRALGVEVVQGQQPVHYLAEREVIVSAGAISSPKLLLLSGIGEPHHLQKVGIKTKVGLLGVGQNLHDHCDVDIVYELKQSLSIDKYKKPGLGAAMIGLEYLLFRKGLAASTGVEGGAFSFTNPRETTPDIQFHFLPAVAVEKGLATVKPGFGCTVNSYFLRPRSRGFVQLACADPDQAPLIDPNYLADEYDFEHSVEGLIQSCEIMAQPSMAKLVKRQHLPPTFSGAIQDREDFRRYVRQFGRTSFHPVGTCKMGQDDHAVVSPELKVYGVDGLRVCDASIMPAIVSSNTHAVTIMIAEKGADLILGKGRE